MMITEEDRKACGVHLGEDGRSVVILDQTQLPNRQVYLTLRTVDEIYDAIKRLSVRGTPRDWDLRRVWDVRPGAGKDGTGQGVVHTRAPGGRREADFFPSDGG